MSLNVRSGLGQLPNHVIIPAIKSLSLFAIGANVGTAINTHVQVGNVPSVGLAKFNTIAQLNQVVEVPNVPGKTLTALIADPDFKVQVNATRPQLPIAGTGRVHGIVATNTPAIVWQTVPTLTFTQGTASNISASQYVFPTSVALTKNAAALPTGVTFNTTLKRFEYNGSAAVGGTNGHILTADDSVGDWATRSTAAGVVFASTLSTASQLSSYYFPTGAEAVQPSVDTTRKPSGQAASIKFTSSPSDGSESGLLRIPFGQTFVPGQTFWFSFRQYMPPEWAYMLSPVSSTGQEQGMKQVILSGVNNSNQAFEIVFEQSIQHGGIYCYNNNALGFKDWTQNIAGDICFQPAIDNSVAATRSPDSIYANVNGGTDPDTGSAFSAQQITWARYGGHYDSRLDPAFAYGLGHPLVGEMRYPVNQWATYTLRVVVGNFGQTNTRVTLWCAPEGSGYTKIYDKTDMRIDSDTDPGYNAAWLGAYYTARLSNQGKSVASRSNSSLSSCTAVRVVGNGSAIGAGTLRYTAATKRFTWQEAGGSIGTARGAASYKRFVNVITGGGTGGYDSGKYLGLEITNFAALPATDQTDTITIQNGRGTQTTNYSELIVSTQAINAPGGFAPT